MRRHRKEPLYRKVNTTAYGVFHHFGGDYRDRRASKEATHQRMAHDVRRGLDYTPLFMFLLSKVGQPWDMVYREAIKRLDREEPLFWLVARHKDEGQPVIRIGESSHYSGLYIDDAGILQIVDPTIGPEQLRPTCRCCTHTFNGKPFTKKYQDDEDRHRES